LCAGGGVSVAAVGGVMRWGGEGLVRDSGVLGLYGYGYGDDARWCKELLGKKNRVVKGEM